MLEHENVRPSISAESFLYSPSLYFTSSDELWYSNEVIVRDSIKKLDKITKTLEQRSLTGPASVRVGLMQSSFKVAAMLRGMSIEAELKGGYYSLEIMSKGHVSKVEGTNQHDLGKLCSMAQFVPTDADVSHLEMLTKIYQLGRYPVHVSRVGKSKVAQTHSFTDIESDYDLRNRIKTHCRDLHDKMQKSIK